MTKRDPMNIVEEGFIEYGNSDKQAVFMPRIIHEFTELTKQAMRNGEDHVTLPTSLASLLACFLDMKVVPWMKDENEP